jgi:hypothetical protein
MRPDLLCGLLAEPERLRVFAAVVLGARSPAAVAASTGLPVRTVMAALRRLDQGGLVRSAEGALVAVEAAFKDAVREHGTPDAPAEPDPGPASPGLRSAGSAATGATREGGASKAPGPARAERAPSGRDPDRQRDAVLRTFIVDGRVPQLPAAWAKRRIVLEHIVSVFEPGVKYPEKDVNAILRAWNDDHAALRRYLVDEGLLERAVGLYWRSGGYVDVV